MKCPPQVYTLVTFLLGGEFLVNFWILKTNYRFIILYYLWEILKNWK